MSNHLLRALMNLAYKGNLSPSETRGQPLFWSQTYCKSKVDEAQVTIELRKLLNEGMLQPFEKSWALPLLLLRKKGGGHRVIMDYRRSKSLTKMDSYHLPCIDDLLRVLSGSKYFSAMNLASG